MELMDIKKEDKLIYQHNVITSGRYDYSACMLDILFMVLSGLEKDKLEYNIHVQDIEIITGRKWNLKQLRESTENIGSRMFEIETPESFEQLWLFSRVKYLKGTGSFTVKLNDEAMPYFFDLKNNFTSMQLKSVLNCSSKYAKRLYAIACQWRSVGIKRFEIEELKKMLGLIDKKGNEQFERISDFKKFVLDVAREQISENTDIELDFELKKRGRSFHWITLHINNQKFKQLEIDFNKPLEIPKIYI
nr:replication initiation protein [Riemerella anatipestifer]